jgi:hypothetical protein
LELVLELLAFLDESVEGLVKLGVFFEHFAELGVD